MIARLFSTLTWFPIVPYGLFLMARYRCTPNVIFAANALGKYGGALFSKPEVYALWEDTEAARCFPAGTIVMPGGPADVAAVTYPLFAKPARGFRGIGTRIIDTPDEMTAFVRQIRVPYIVQEFLPYPHELKVSFLRWPGGRCEILGIARVGFPSVTGDGETPLRSLVRDVEKHRHLERKYGSLEYVPGRGEPVELIGPYRSHEPHLNTDRPDLVTEAVQRAFADIVEPVPGLHIGRFDVLTEDLDAFRQGRGFRIVEGNLGPACHPLFPDTMTALPRWRWRFRHWDTVFRLGKMNRTAETGTVRGFIREKGREMALVLSS